MQQIGEAQAGFKQFLCSATILSHRSPQGGAPGRSAALQIPDYRCSPWLQAMGEAAMRRIWGALLVLSLGSAAAGQQVVNPNADMSVPRPAYRAEQGPRVLIDEGHANFHTVGGRYAPFAALLRNDGYRVAANPGAFTAAGLADADILVIANAAPAASASAFTPEEVAAVRAWVEGGGALLLIADHKPFAGAASALGEAFGVHCRDAYAVNPGSRGADIFRTAAGLSDHVIVTGAGGDAAVTQLRTFTGSAFDAPAARPLVTLGEGFQLITGAGVIRVDPNDRSNSAAGLLQGAALEAGRGRVVVMGEAAMFTSQLAGPEQRVMGIGAPGTEQNKQFALNLMHWLSRRPGY
jgi:hypothetical protein